MRALVAAVAAVFLATAAAPAQAAAAPEGPALTVPSGALAASLHCTQSLAGAKRDPVLLTPAFSTDKTSYSWNYLARLPKIGVPVCSISVADEGYGDLQRTAEHVVYAVRAMAAASGRKVVVLGHQHGALDELWALTFWPDVARQVSDFVSLATPYRGTTSSAALCGATCAAATRQITKGSAFLGALGRAPLPRGPSYTSIASLTDSLIVPQPEASTLTGARNVQVQDICPGRQVSHFEILADAVAYRLVIDAIDHDGPADPARIPRSVCGERLMPDADPLIPTLANAFLPGFVATNVSRGTPTEPAVRGYAARKAPAVTIATSRARLSRRGTLGVRIVCRSVGQTVCATRLSLRTPARRFAGARSGRIAPTRATVLRVRVPRAARTRIRARQRVGLRATVRATDALGNARSVTRRITVRG